MKYNSMKDISYEITNKFIHHYTNYCGELPAEVHSELEMYIDFMFFKLRDRERYFL